MPKKFPIEVMSTGTWNGIKFTIDDLKEMAANFLALKNVIKPPIKLGHTKDETGAPAYGWISGLKVVGQKLVAYAEDLPDLLLKAIRAKRYRRVSSEVFFQFEYDGKKYGKVFSALALLGAETPAVKDLEDLQAYLSQNTENGTFDKLMAFDSPSDFESIEYYTEEHNMDKEIEKKLQSFEDRIVKLTNENAQLKADKEAAEAATDKLKKEQFAEKKKANVAEFKAFCDKRVEDGKMLPAQRDALVAEDNAAFDEDGALVISLETFKSHIDLADKVLDKEQHAKDDERNPEKFTSVQEEVDVKTKKYMADKGEKDYQTALFAVLDSDKDLSKRYQGNFAARETD